MKTINQLEVASSIARLRSLNPGNKSHWNIRWQPVCASTESSLTNWLYDQPLLLDEQRAFFASSQTNGFGQQGKVWQSPIGGVWVSAAFPIAIKKLGAGVLGLALAVALVERLELQGISSKIKWPNDVMVDGRKLAGLLPRLVIRGNQIRFARIGLGLNVSNVVPPEGIQLIEICKDVNCKVEFWSSEVLMAIDKVIDTVEKTEWICRRAEEYLWAEEVIDSDTKEVWRVLGIENNGALKLGKGNLVKICSRW